MTTNRRNRSTSLTERHQDPALVVGSFQGDVAVVQAQTGARLWHEHTGRKLATLAQDGARFYAAPGVLHALQRQAQRLLGDQKRAYLLQRLREEAAVPTVLTGRRLEDGSLVWTYTDWSLTGPLRLAVDGNTLLAGLNSPHGRGEAMPSIYALDTASGRVLWTTPESSHGSFDSVIDTGGGRALVRLARGSQLQDLQVLETRTGRELWRTEHGSLTCLPFPQGRLVAQQQPAGSLPGSMLTVLRAEDGSQLSRFPLSGKLQLFTDGGVAYSASTSTDPGQAWVAAMDTTTGEGDVWRTDGVLAHTLALDGGQLYYAGVRRAPHAPLRPAALAEVGALDVHTGRQLWAWHSPHDTAALLRLWGTRTPAMLLDSAKKSWATIADALADPRQRTVTLRRELQIGQWRHPYTLHGSINALWLEAWDGLVYVGTQLGLFALNEADGTLKWHGLPDLDLSFLTPALPPR